MSGSERQELPKHILKDKDRHGRTRYYYRKLGQPMVRLRAEPGTPEFDAQYAAAMNGLCAASETPGQFVYFFRQGNLVKIGHSRDPASRLRSMLTGNAKHIEWTYSTPGGRALERALHEKFAEFRVRREWFFYSAEIQVWINEDQQRRIELVREQKRRLKEIGLSHRRSRTFVST